MGRINCDFCREEPGLLLMTNQETGDTQSTGPNCMPEFVKQLAMTYGVWPKIEDVLTDELVRAEAVKRGMISPKLEAAVEGTAKRGRGRKPANAGAETIAESAAMTRAAVEPPNYDQIPYELDTDEGRAARDKTAHDQMQAATGGQ